MAFDFWGYLLGYPEKVRREFSGGVLDAAQTGRPFVTAPGVSRMLSSPFTPALEDASKQAARLLVPYWNRQSERHNKAMENIFGKVGVDFDESMSIFQPLENEDRVAQGILALGGVASLRSPKKGVGTVKEFLTDLFSGGVPGKTKTYHLVKKASEQGKISDLERGKSLGNANIQGARSAWKSDGSLDNWHRSSSQGGRTHTRVAETWSTGKGFLPNVPEQRKFLRSLKLKNYPQGYGNLVDDMTDAQVASHLSDYKRFIKSGDKNDAYMRPLGSDHVSFNASGKHITSSAELQRQAANMSEKDVMSLAKSTAYNYISRARLERGNIPDATFNRLVNYLAKNIRERNRQFATSPPLWQLGAGGIYENNPILALQTHHGNPIEFGGPGLDLRNLFAASGALQSGGTHRLMHHVQPKVLEGFYKSLKGRHYNPFYEAALKTARQKEEPYSGFLDIVQETNPDLWDYNMRQASEIFRNKKNIWGYQCQYKSAN